MPLSHEILIPGPEPLGIGGARRRAFTPDLGQASRKDPVCHHRDRIAQGIALQKAPPRVQEFAIGHPKPAGDDALQSGIGAKSVQTQQRASLHLTLWNGLAVCCCLEALRKTQSQIGFGSRMVARALGPPARL